MPLITWNTTLSVNYKEIDAQHQRWVALINQLHEAMSQGKGREIMGQVLAELLDYTRTHFVTEERIMVDHAYPDYQRQKAAHDAFIQKVGDLRTRFLGGEAVITLDVMKFIKEWLTNHIQVMDKKIGVYLNGTVAAPAK